jgi:nitrate/nitrite transporter NarK
MAQTSMEMKKDARRAFFFGLLALFLISFAAMSSYFSYDEIGALAPRLRNEMGFSSTNFLALYTAYSISAVLFSVMGGVLADKLGVRKAAILFASMFAFGTLIVTIPKFWAMLGGRFLFGIGCEAYYVVMQKVIAKWFKHKMLATAFGVNLLLCRLGTYASFFLLPWIADHTSTSSTLWIVTGITFLGLASTGIYWFLDGLGERRKYVAILEESAGSSEKFSLKDVFRLPKPFWVISLLCVVFYSAIFPFTAFSTDFFVEQFKMTNQTAARLTGLIILISMCSTWLIGAVIDSIGKRATIMIIGAAMMVPCHVAIGYSSIDPRIPMIILGLSFSLVPAALWPAVPRLVKEKQLGTAYGVIAMIQNIGLGLFPLLAGRIRDHYGSYKPAMIMFSSLAILGVIFASWLKVLEKKGGGYLDKNKPL